MFNRLSKETNLHILSFLSDRELASCSLVCKGANNQTMLLLKERMKAFSIGKERLKTLCLMHPELAKFGIDIDATRSRYLLLVTDITDIALMKEEVAEYILNNNKLRNAERLDRIFSNKICINFPNLAIQLFSINNTKLPNQEEIVDIITKHPILFKQLYTNQRFISLINKSKILVDLALINEKIASLIINNDNKFSKLDKNWMTMEVGKKYESVALSILNNPAYKEVLYDDNLLILGNAHVEAAKIIIENRAFTSKLKDEQLFILQEKVMEEILSLTMDFK